MSVWPSQAERTSLRFVFIPKLPLLLRYLIAAAAFSVGGYLLFFYYSDIGEGLFYIPLPFLFAHLVLWTRSQTNAPGGATPNSKDLNWVPVDDDWPKKLQQIEAKARAWDLTPWEITNWQGILTAIVVIGLPAFAISSLRGLESPSFVLRSQVMLMLTLAPMWLSGTRSIWHPSELSLKLDALANARKRAKEHSDRFEIVTLMALTETRRGKYPVDVRMMLRPKAGAEGFIGVQIQVALNNVQGRDYPYLYCVILTEEKGRLPELVQRPGLVIEPGSGSGAQYLVVRQRADNSGGWHTSNADIFRILNHTLKLTEGMA
ncbi:hypothetical protein G6O69_14630 [Pseudenhygromyxa sp. WMMC2535]|uniref:hypothetical protein n=1 Tax=Pseudenhygromyxa sp. WMMC2535 TaxID=2712867 RepID=UPI00155564CE|nr:hypothetical protein [Pseudenhygromyxa sp. WMMC2535]NVB39076.1 hypothetical protein [Pseudenhygromyxa sp. WMMC2535]